MTASNSKHTTFPALDTGSRLRVAVLAHLPIWNIDESGRFDGYGESLSWLESLFPSFGKCDQIQVDWIVVSKSIRKVERLLLKGQRVHVVPRWKKSISILSGYRSESRVIRKIVDEIAPDVIHAWGSEDVYGIVASTLNYPKLFTMQGCLTDYLNKLSGPFLFRRQASFERQILSGFDEATAETPLAREQLLSIDDRLSCHLVDYGVNQTFHDAVWDPSFEPIVLFVGGINKRKGIGDLIELFKRPDFTRITLKIAGDGELREKLATASSSNVEWLGSLSQDAVCHEMSKAWCFAMPTYADTGPTVVKEARVVGLPVVTTTQAGAQCYIDQGKSGFVVKPGALDDMASAILACCQDRNECLNLGHHRHASVKAELHPARTVEKFSTIYRGLVKQES